MKRRAQILLTAALSIPATAVLAQSSMKGMDMAPKPAAGVAATHKASATVTKIDREAGTVTLAHGPIPTLNWPAMTMAFKVKDKQLFEKLAVGRKVHAKLVQDGKGYAVTAVE